jgi:5-methylcytosine-specific restriction endonuclease McrA
MEIWESQNGNCAITGLPMEPGETASLDHVIPIKRNGNHARANLRFIHLAINRMKGDMTDDELREFLKDVLPRLEAWTGTCPETMIPTGTCGSVNAIISGVVSNKIWKHLL